MDEPQKHSAKKSHRGGWPERSYPTSEVGVVAEELPHVRGWGGGREELPMSEVRVAAERTTPCLR